MGVHGEGVHAANIGVRYVAYFQAIFPMSFRWTQIKVKPPTSDVKGSGDLLHLPECGTLYGGILECGTFYERGTYMHDLCMV